MKLTVQHINPDPKRNWPMGIAIEVSDGSFSLPIYVSYEDLDKLTPREAAYKLGECASRTVGLFNEKLNHVHRS